MQSKSVPAFVLRPYINVHENERRDRSFSNRPLPLPPISENNEKLRKPNSFRITTVGPPLEDCRSRKRKELVRRKTVPNIQRRKPLYGQIFGESDEDHIYEEIDDLTEGEKKMCYNSNSENTIDAEEMSFLLLISSERRKNLKLYGSTGWDFGTGIK
jgi:hypothetical protein